MALTFDNREKSSLAIDSQWNLLLTLTATASLINSNRIFSVQLTMTLGIDIDSNSALAYIDMYIAILCVDFSVDKENTFNIHTNVQRPLIT